MDSFGFVQLSRIGVGASGCCESLRLKVRDFGLRA